MSRQYFKRPLPCSVSNICFKARSNKSNRLEPMVRPITCKREYQGLLSAVGSTYQTPLVNRGGMITSFNCPTSLLALQESTTALYIFSNFGSGVSPACRSFVYLSRHLPTMQQT